MSDFTSPSLLGTRPAVVAALAAGDGFLTWPCCVLPALLAFAGTGSAALGQTIAAHRPAFLVVSAILFAGSLWINLHLQTRPVNRWIVVARRPLRSPWALARVGSRTTGKEVLWRFNRVTNIAAPTPSAAARFR